MEGLGGGALLFFGTGLLDADRWVVGAVAVILLAAVLSGWHLRDELRAWNARSIEDSRLWREWDAERRWRWTLVAAALVGLGLAGYARYRGDPYLFHVVFLPLLYLTVALAAFLTASGTIDPDDRTLTYSHSGLLGGYDREEVYDLDALAGVRRLRLGGRALLLLAFEDVPQGGGLRRLVWVPTAVANETAPVLERGIRADGRLTAAARSERTVLRTGLALFLGLGLVLLAIGYAGGTARYFASFAALATFGWFSAVLLAHELGFI